MTDLEILQLFNERATRLRRLRRFVESINSERGVTAKFSADGVEVIELAPDEESLSAAILTLRMFIQNNEPISFGNMAKLYFRINVPLEMKDRFHGFRVALNDYLDRFSPLSIGNNAMVIGTPLTDIAETDSGRLTNRKVMDVYIYGDYSHSSLKEREIFDKISRNPLFAPIGNLVFSNIIKALVTFIEHTTELNQEAIEYIQDEARWDKSFEQTQPQLIEAARCAKQEIADGKASEMDYDQL